MAEPVITGPYPFEKNGHEYYKVTVKVGNIIDHHVFKTEELANIGTVALEEAAAKREPVLTRR